MSKDRRRATTRASLSIQQQPCMQLPQTAHRVHAQVDPRTHSPSKLCNAAILERQTSLPNLPSAQRGSLARHPSDNVPAPTPTSMNGFAFCKELFCFCFSFGYGHPAVVPRSVASGQLIPWCYVLGAGLFVRPGLSLV